MLNRRQEVLTVAKEAVFRQDQKDYVFIVLENKARLTEVLVGARGDRRYEILEGLEENDQVIILSTEDVIEDGDRISY
jgi:multidrug efflux pump subunit AcrA (membrane-fusion protein)